MKNNNKTKKWKKQTRTLIKVPKTGLELPKGSQNQNCVRRLLAKCAGHLRFASWSACVICQQLDALRVKLEMPWTSASRTLIFFLPQLYKIYCFLFFFWEKKCRNFSCSPGSSYILAHQAKPKEISYRPLYAASCRANAQASEAMDINDINGY